jgi:hypothetical protein
MVYLTLNMHFFGFISSQFEKCMVQATKKKNLHVAPWAKCLCQVHLSTLTMDVASNFPVAPAPLVAGSAVLVHRQIQAVLTLQLFFTAQPFV